MASLIVKKMSIKMKLSTLFSTHVDRNIKYHKLFGGQENPRRQWSTGKPGMLQSITSQKVGHNRVTVQKQQKGLNVGLPWWSSSWESACNGGHEPLLWEDPTCHGATKSVHHKYWACTLEPQLCNKRSPRRGKPEHYGQRAAPFLATRKSTRSNEDHHSQKQ